MISPTAQPDSSPTTADAWRAPEPFGPWRAARRAAWNLTKRAVGSAGSGLNWLAGGRAKDRFGVLMYHRVTNHVAGTSEPTWNVEPRRFRQQLTGLLNRGYRPWSLTRAIEAHRAGESIPRATFVVTFDDIHESVYRHAWPVLHELGIPATGFLATAFLDSSEPFPFEDWDAARSTTAPSESWRPIRTSQCREMADSGLFELAAHTHSHEDFCGRTDAFERDLAENLNELRAKFGVDRPSFAFPFGRATPAMMQVVRDAGCTAAMMDTGLLVDPSQEPFGWSRIHVEPWDSASTLAAKLNGWYSPVVRIQRGVSARRRPECIY